MIEETLGSICRRLLKVACGDERFVVEEYDVPTLDNTPSGKCFVAKAGLGYPCCGKDRIEALSWLAAQALYLLPPAHHLALEIHDELVKNGITIPSRSVFEGALENARQCRGA